MDELLEIFDKFIWIRVNSRVWLDDIRVADTSSQYPHMQCGVSRHATTDILRAGGTLQHRESE